jgi:hypothetical protein
LIFFFFFTGIAYLRIKIASILMWLTKLYVFNILSVRLRVLLELIC